MSATPSDEEIRRRLEQQVIDQVVDGLAAGHSRDGVIDALMADGFDRAAACAYVDRVIRSPEGATERAVARRVASRLPLIRLFVR